MYGVRGYFLFTIGRTALSDEQRPMGDVRAGSRVNCSVKDAGPLAGRLRNIAL
jgi:hypothetical protein